MNWLLDFFFFIVNRKIYRAASEVNNFKLLKEIVDDTRSVFFNNLWSKIYLSKNFFPPEKISQSALDFFSALIEKNVDVYKIYPIDKSNDKTAKSLLWFILNLSINVKNTEAHKIYSKFIFKYSYLFKNEFLNNYEERIGFFKNQAVLYWVHQIKACNLAKVEKEKLLQKTINNNFQKPKML